MLLLRNRGLFPNPRRLFFVSGQQENRPILQKMERVMTSQMGADEMDVRVPRLETAKVHLTLREGLPFWTVTHYLETGLLNHMKLVSIQKLCMLMVGGHTDQSFAIATQSADLYEPRTVQMVEHLEPTLIPLFQKDESPSRFWGAISSLRRPVILFRTRGTWVPLYDPFSRDSSRIRDLKEHSPLEVVIEGASDALRDLYASRERHLNPKWVNQSAGDDVSQTTFTASSLNRVPEYARIHAQNAMASIVDAQARLNDRVGLKPADVLFL
jgi:hypothetical protein